MDNARLILYSKPGCHLCEGLEEKLSTLQLPLTLEVRDITTQADWWQRYRYEIPVLQVQTSKGTTAIPRFSPRASATRVGQILQQYLVEQS
ncbi:MAG: glutaredoxin family protein [Elainellaceae cyanobacterium]